MEQLKQLYEKIDAKVPVLLLLIFVFILTDLYYINEVFVSFSSIEEYKKIPAPPKPQPFKKEEIPPIERFDIETMKEIPEAYKIITLNNIYVNPNLNMAKDGGLTAPPIVEDDFGDQKDGENNENGKIDIVHLKKRLEETQQLREIKGYYVNGIVKNVNNPDEIDAVLLISNTGQKYYAREGEIIKGTLITVKEINSGNVIISKPGFKDTEIPFKMERLLQKWKNN